MKRFLLGLLGMLMLLPGLWSVATMLLFLPGYFGGHIPKPAEMGAMEPLTQMSILWAGGFAISWAGWLLLRRLSANAPRY
jgi:hypothetical protein